MAAPEKIQFPERQSHRKYRAALKKEKRKKRRQELARLRDSGLSQKEEEEDAFIEEHQLEEEKLLEKERSALISALKVNSVILSVLSLYWRPGGATVKPSAANRKVGGLNPLRGSTGEKS
nr:U2 small nuclear ribonucleoprotein auxiliary factor 35 kDa subunit-related protein 2-like isoform X2 [Loxodonta africana]